jgi:hypothetical protein
MYLQKEINPYYPINPHRYYKGVALKKPDKPVGTVNDCGYTAETPTTEETCYVKQFLGADSFFVSKRLFYKNI